MKYPQLVSTKAVHEISDWLIKRLEELDIEHPCVYSRLLLSLLHTPLKINAIDLLEDLKQPYRLLNKNNEELKRLAAVESLMEVSAEENKSNIVNLVNELHMKLQKVENNNLEESSISMIGRASNSAAPSPNNSTVSSKFYKSLKKIKRHHVNENPTKNYYLAFPALNSNKKVMSHDLEGSKEAPNNLNLLSWSNLIANSDSNMRESIANATQNQSQQIHENAIKTPQNQQRRKQKRFDKRECGNRRIQKANPTDVQFTTKTYNATFSPKKMQKVKSNANSNVNNSSKAKHQRNLYDSSAKRVVSSNRNTNLSNIAQNASKRDGNTLGPWDMDFHGQWEMDHDLIGEFIQKQHGNDFRETKKSSAESITRKKIADIEDDDAMFMKCLPTKLIDESLVDESDPLKPCFYNKKDHSISSLQSKFDEKVKAIWSEGDDNDQLKPLTYKQQFSEDDGISLASLASSFASEKNSLSLFNFNEQQQRNFVIEVNVPPFYNEMTSSYDGGGKVFLTDYNNNNNVASLYGGRGVMNKSSPLRQTCDYPLKKSDFIKSGTNLQTSIWSEENFPSEAESLILKKEVGDKIDYDGSDEVDSTCKKLSSIGTELKQWQSSSADEDDEEVSLFNHSDQSAFKRFKPQSTMMSSSIIRANYHPLNMSHSERSKRVDSSSSRESTIENYLTSEETHFSPIMLDGHTFTVDKNWDEIEWKRSESGTLTHKNKPYQLWKGNVNENRSFSSSGIDLEAMEDDADPDKFNIKFALNENNKASQTDESDFVTFKRINYAENRSYLEINEEYCRRKLYDEYFKGVNENISNSNKWRNLNNGNEDSNDYSLFSVNRYKSNNENSLKPFLDLSSNNSSSSSICTITSTLDTVTVDPFESWRNFKVEHNINQTQTCMHSLWEQCIACAKNIDEDKFIEKPLPANRLLKDELQMDGDEIMNVIQNLYITSSDFCADDEEKDDGFDMNHVMNLIAMDDSMDGIEDESKFYETSTICQKNREEIMLEEFDEITHAKVQDMDQEKCIQWIKKWIQSSLVPVTQDSNNNNECLEVHHHHHRPANNNRKRRHSTCQNLMEKKRYYSQEEGFTYHLNLDSAVTPTTAFLNDFAKNPFDVNNLLFDASKMLKINIEKVFLIADPCLEMEAIKEYQQQTNNNYCGANYYRNILQQQHALMKHLDLSRPLTR